MLTGTINELRPDDLDLDATLTSGQMFRWTRDSDGFWRGTVGQTRLRLRQIAPGASLEFETDSVDGESFIRSFLRLDDLDLPRMASEWSVRDDLFADAWRRQRGVRLLRQDPDECFFAFLCASVAPIARIGGMLRAVAGAYGVDSHGDGFLPFPTATMIAAGDEDTLRQLGLGFRARRVIEAAQVLSTLPVHHLSALRQGATHAEAKRELRGFFGVGEKIADCVCLFSLDKDGAIPVDTHIWRIAHTRYLPDLAGRSLTEVNYARVVAAFHDRFGPHAGWAQQILFYRAAVGRNRQG